MKSITSKIYIILFVIIIVWLVNSIFFSRSDVDEYAFIIEQGESVNNITERLHEAGYIKSEFIFKSYLQLTDNSTSIKAGEHTLTNGMSMSEIITELNSARAEKDLQITIIEGWDNFEIAEYLEESINMLSNDFLAAASRSRTDYSWLPSSTVHNFTQGYLFPDTYRILPDATPEDIVVKLLDTFDVKIYQPLESSIAKHLLSLHEILTLASIIEEEVRLESDRMLVADIFLRRLADNYPLQSDATVNYITKSGRAQSSIEDTKIDSPYNTYKYSGLPPGPIGSPALTAIEAVLNPMPNTYYFFLTVDDGRVIYSHTYSEHLQNKAKYLD